MLFSFVHTGTMTSWIFCNLCALMFLLCLRWSSAALCGSLQSLPYVKIPADNTLMSVQDFDQFVVGRQMAEMYYALPDPPAYIPDVNYFSTITKIAGASEYLQNSMGESVEQNPKCVRGSVTLNPVAFSDRALFFIGSSSTVQAHWSSCPQRYMMSMRCNNYSLNMKKCPVSDTVLAVYINGTLDNLPVTDIVEDLCMGTGVKLGAGNFKWFFSYGENTLC